MKKLVLGGVIVLATSAAWAQAPAPVIIPAAPWQTTVSAGANVTRGNSETMALNGGVNSVFKQEHNEARVGIEGNYGQSQITQGSGSNETKKTDTTLNNVRAFGEYRRLLTDRTYAYGNAEVLHDDIAEIDYRATLGPGMGRYFLMSDKQKLSAEGGMAYIKERVAGDDDDRVVLRVSERYDLKVGATASVWEQVEYMPTVDDMSQCLINSEVGAEAAMNAKLSLRVVLQDKYNSTPAPGKEDNDLAVIAALTYKL